MAFSMKPLHVMCSGFSCFSISCMIICKLGGCGGGYMSVHEESKLLSFASNVCKNKDYLHHHYSDFSLNRINHILQFQQSHPNYKQTPLHQLKHLANYLGLGNIYVKDESYRFHLNAFKVLGGIYAIGKYLANELGRDIHTLSFNDLTSSDVKRRLGDLTFITATDGNHGKGIAWAARELGHRSVVYMPKGTTNERVRSIQAEGAQVKVIKGNYDEAVRLAANDAKEHSWILLQDTSWDGYERIPHWIMQGYSSLAKEIVEEIADKQLPIPTHVFLQVGVGSFAAAVAIFFTHYYKERCPRIFLIEPHRANCYYQSFVEQKENYKVVSGDLQTIMAGLSCGVPNPKAWELLKWQATGAFSVADPVAALGMRLLGNPLPKDVQITSGESGAVPAGLLYCLTAKKHYHTLKEKLALNEHAHVLFINTEGDTDESHYRKIVWEGAFSL